MTIEVLLPDEIVAAIDRRTGDRAAFIQAAVRAFLDEEGRQRDARDAAIINAHSAELNAEAEDVLAFQVIP